MGGPQTISMDAIRSYMEIKQMGDPDQRERFIRYIQAMDQQYIDMKSEDD